MKPHIIFVAERTYVIDRGINKTQMCLKLYPPDCPVNEEMEEGYEFRVYKLFSVLTHCVHNSGVMSDIAKL